MTENESIVTEGKAEETSVPLQAENEKPLRLLAPVTGTRSFWNGIWKEKKYLGLCFLIPALLMWLMYICMGVYPFGEESVLVLDLNGQYVYFFEGLRDILRGDGSLLYSFSRALGGEFMGIFAYYLSSPFSLLVLLFPDNMITEALLLMFLLKTGCCGLTFGIYIEATRQRNRTATVIFSTMYALCAYAVVMQHNTMWIDNLILLPIVMLGIENLIKFGRFKMYVISLSMAIFSNFYIGYMMCIFSAAYYFYSYFSTSPDERNPLGEKRHFIRSSGRMVLYSLISVAICSALLICTYYSLKFGKTEFSNPSFTPDQKFDWADLVTKVFAGSYDTVRPEGLPFLYSGMLSLILLPLYFFAPHIKTREKIASGLLIVFFLVSFNITTLDLFWHGMQRPNWLNYRYSFMLCFFIVLFAYKAFEKLREIGYRKAVCVCAVLAIILLALQKLDYKNVEDFQCVWLSLVLCVIYICALRGVTYSKKEIRDTSLTVLAILVSAEMFCCGLLNLVALDADVVYSSRTSYRSFIDRIQPVVDKIESSDKSFYRMEKTLHRKTNDNFTLGINGLSNSTSTLNESTITFLNRTGLSSKSHWTKYLGGTPVLDSLLGLKYIITESDSEEQQEMYNEKFTYDNDLTVYENPYVLPLAYGVNKDLEDVDMASKDMASPFERMNAIVTAMLGESDTVEVFSPARCSSGTLEHLKSSAVAGHTKYATVNENNSSTAAVEFSVYVESDDVLYCYFPSDYPREAELYINGMASGSYFGNESCRIVELGSFDPGDTVTVRLSLCESEMYIRNADTYFYYLDSDTFAEVMPELDLCGYRMNEDWNDDHFTGTINIEDGRELVFTSIPYDKGWKVYVDGQTVETEEVLDALLAFKAEPGEHTLELRYWPDCLTWGLMIQAAGLAAFAAAWVVSNRRRKRQLENGARIYCPSCPEIMLQKPDAEVFDAASPEDLCSAVPENVREEARVITEESSLTVTPDNAGEPDNAVSVQEEEKDGNS